MSVVQYNYMGTVHVHDMPLGVTGVRVGVSISSVGAGLILCRLMMHGC